MRFRKSYFGAAYGFVEGGGGGGGGGTPSLKSVSHFLQRRNLAQLYLTQSKSKNYINHLTHPLSSAGIIIFLPRISKVCYIKKSRYRFHLDT